MKIEYWHVKKQEHRLLNTDDIDVDMENGYRLCVDNIDGVVEIKVIDKNNGKRILDKTADEFVSELKGDK